MIVLSGQSSYRRQITSCVPGLLVIFVLFGLGLNSVLAQPKQYPVSGAGEAANSTFFLPASHLLIQDGTLIQDGAPARHFDGPGPDESTRRDLVQLYASPTSSPFRVNAPSSSSAFPLQLWPISRPLPTKSTGAPYGKAQILQYLSTVVLRN